MTNYLIDERDMKHADGSAITLDPQRGASSAKKLASAEAHGVNAPGPERQISTG